jgi:hypothetical protein
MKNVGTTQAWWNVGITWIQQNDDNEITTCRQIATLTSKKKTCKKTKTKTKTSIVKTLPHWSCEVQVWCKQTITSNHNHDKCKCDDNQIVNILARQKLMNAGMMEQIMISTITKWTLKWKGCCKV